MISTTATLARWNGIGPDYRISVGQILSLRPALPPVETPR